MVLGSHIFRNQEMTILTVCQSRYAQRILAQFRLESAKGQTAMDDNFRLMQDADLSSEPYGNVIGTIIYSMVETHPDLAHSVCPFAKFGKSQTEIHWMAVQRVLKCILSTKHFGLG